MPKIKNAAIAITVTLLASCSACRGSSPAAPDGQAASETDARRAEETPAPSETAAASALGDRFPGKRLACPSGFTLGLTEGHHEGFLSAKQKRKFDLALPPARFKGPRPLLFAWHGTGMTGAQAIAAYRLDQWVEAGFIVVAPDSNGNGNLWPVWDAFSLPNEAPRPNADLTLFDDLLQCVAAHHPVDAKRIFVAGHSAGGAMTHYTLGRRSNVLAGGIAGSGAFDLTQPPGKSPVDPLTVIVTWGGMNDVYSGSAGSSSLSNVAYAEQSSIASQHWKAQAGTYQIACKGNELGHAWLDSINGWMRDVLVAHPKGSAVVSGYRLPVVPGDGRVACSEDAAVYKSPITVSCPTSSTPGCKEYCQLMGKCLAENGTLGPMAVGQLGDLGYSKAANVCGGCVASCEADARGSDVDKTVLGCFATAAPATTCGPGFAGAAMFGTVEKCCAKSASKVCARFCATFKKNASFATQLGGCP